MAFKMSPIGRNKDPYASIAKRGYIAPTKQNTGVGYTKQGIKIDDPKKGQSTVDKAAEDNVVWNEPGDWQPANDGTNREKRTTTGVGKAQGYYEEENEITEFMGNEKWKEFLKTPKGQEYLAAKNRSKTEFRERPETEKPKASNVTGVQKVRADVVNEYDVQNPNQTHTPKNDKWVNIPGHPDGGYYVPSYKKTNIQAQYKDGLGIGEEIPEGANVNMVGLKEGLNDNIVQDKVGVTTGMKVRDDQNLKNLEKIQEVKNFTDEPTVSDDLDASTTIVEQRTPIYKKYMHKSIAKQNDDKVISDDNTNVKTTYISNNESPKKGSEGWKENKQRYENAKLLTNELKASGQGDKSDLDLNLSYQKMMPEIEITAPAKQVRGHSIATQCAKSEGGSGCVKKVGSGWKVISNKTGKYWDATYDSEEKADAALKAYHAG